MLICNWPYDFYTIFAIYFLNGIFVYCFDLICYKLQKLGLKISTIFSFAHVMGLAKELTPIQKGGIIAAKKLGHNNTEIAKAIGCHWTTVTRCLAAYESGAPPKKRSGRPCLIDSQKRQRLKAMVLKNKELRRKSLAEITNTFSAKINKPVSTKTIRHALHKENVHYCIPQRKPLISVINKSKWLA